MYEILIAACPDVHVRVLSLTRARPSDSSSSAASCSPESREDPSPRVQPTRPSSPLPRRSRERESNIDDVLALLRACIFFFIFFPSTFSSTLRSYASTRWDSSRRDTQLVAISSQVVSRRAPLSLSSPRLFFSRFTHHFITFRPFLRLVYPSE